MGNGGREGVFGVCGSVWVGEARGFVCGGGGGMEERSGTRGRRTGWAVQHHRGRHRVRVARVVFNSLPSTQTSFFCCCCVHPCVLCLLLFHSHFPPPLSRILSLSLPTLTLRPTPNCWSLPPRPLSPPPTLSFPPPFPSLCASPLHILCRHTRPLPVKPTKSARTPHVRHCPLLPSAPPLPMMRMH